MRLFKKPVKKEEDKFVIFFSFYDNKSKELIEFLKSKGIEVILSKYLDKDSKPLFINKEMMKFKYPSQPCIINKRE